MSRLCTILFLTFVRIVTVATVIISFVYLDPCLAAPSTPSPDFPPSSKDDEPATPVDTQKLETIDITPPPPGAPLKIDRPTEFFYPFRKAITLRLGAAYDTKAVSDGKGTLITGGASFLFPYQLQSYEVAADLYSDGSGLLHGYRRDIYGSGRFRPYTKIGAGVRIVPADQLATVLRYEHYQLRGGGGAELLVYPSTSSRVDLELAASARGVQALLSLGIVFAW